MKTGILRSLTIFALAATVAAGGATVSPALAAGKDITFALDTPVLNLDPGVGTDSNAVTVQQQIIETLVRTSAATGDIEPCLATSWQVGADNQTWTFKLRPNVKFQDGGSLTAADVAASIGRVIKPGSGLNRSSDLAIIAGVRAVDDQTVEITTKGPASTLLQTLTLSSAGVVSKKSIDEHPNDLAWRIVGTGPFKFVGHAPQQSVTLARNDDYWGKKPEIQTLTFLTVTEPATRLAMLQTHQADIIDDVPAPDLTSLKSDASVSLLEKPTTRVAHIGFNTGKAPFDNVKVRQAIAFAIDRQGIIDGVISGLGVATDSIISPGLHGYKAQPIYEYNPDKAKQLLAEAGRPNGFSAIIFTPQGRYYMDREIVVAIQAQLKQIGIDADVQVVDWSGYIHMLQQPQATTKIQMYFLGWESNINDIEYILDTVFDSSRAPPAGWNTMFYSNPKVDQLITQIRQALDPQHRQQLVDEVQQLIMQDAPWVPLFSYVNVAAFRSDITGVEYFANDTFRLQDVTFK